MPHPAITIRRRGDGIEFVVQTSEGPGASIVLTGREASEFEGIAPRFSKDAGHRQIVYMRITTGFTDLQLVTQDLTIPKGTD